MENQKLQTKTKVIIAVIAILMLVASVVLGVVLNLTSNEQVSNEPMLTMDAEILSIREYKAGEKLLSNEILSGKEQSDVQSDENQDVKTVDQIAGRGTKKANANTPSIEYIKKNDVITMYLKGIDDKVYKSNTLNVNDIEVYVGDEKQNGVQKELNLISESSANGVKYGLAITNITGNGELSVRVAANTLENEAGLKNTQAIQAVFGNPNNSDTKKIIVDNNKPTVIITADKTSPTPADSVTYTFTFSENVYDFIADDITVENGTKGAFSGSGTTYTLVVTNNGTCTQKVSVAADVCRDIAYNKNTASQVITMQIDRTAPKAIITGKATEVTDGLVRHYDATNNLGNGHSNDTTTWKDLSGNQGADETNNVHNVTFSNDGYASFNGWVNLGQYNPTNAVTAEAEITLNSIQSGEREIICNYQSGGFGLHLVDGKPTFQAVIAGSWRAIQLDEVLDLNRTYHIAGTYDGTIMRLYVDGIEHASLNVTGNIKEPNDSTVLAMGVNPSGSSAGGNYANINIYSARVYSRALTQEEIKQNMNADRVKSSGTTFNLATNNDSVTLSLVFDEDIQTLSTDAITVTNGTKGALTKINDHEYTLAISNIQGTSILTVTIDGTKYKDIAGNNGTSYTINRYRDVSGPGPTITANPSTSPTAADSIEYTIAYHEPTTGFSVDDITVTNGTKGTFTRVNSKQFKIVVTNTGSCTQTVSVPVRACYDEKGNPSGAGTKSVVIDRSGPQVEFGANGNTSYAKTQSTTVTVTDTPAGVDTSSLKYKWTQSTTAPQESDFTQTFTNQGTVTTPANLTGNNWYLWILAKDTLGNKTVIKSNAFYLDNTAPTLSLAKETYQEGFDGWELSGASIDNDGVLTITELDKKIGQKYYRTEKEPWYITYDAYVTNASTTSTTGGFTGSAGAGEGGIYWESYYYDTNYNEATANNGNKANGFIGQLPLSTWSNDIRGSYGTSYGSTTEYTKIVQSVVNAWSNPPIKLRNFKMHGQLYEEFYDINLTSNGTGSNLVSTKWLAGNHTVADFASAGENIENNTFRVTQNGTYTVYVEDEAGNSTVSTIEVTKIDKTAPTIDAAAEFNGGNISFTAKDTAPNANETPSGVVGYQITDSNTAPTSGWTNVEVPEITTVDGKKQTSKTITLTNTQLSAGTHYIWVIDAAGHKTSKQINVYYTIALNAGTGISSQGTETVKANAATLPDITIPTKVGYDFKGYYTAVNGGGTQYYGADGKAVKGNDFTQDTILYAKWEGSKYTVTANSNGGTIATTSGWTGTGETATKQVTYDATYGTLPTVSRTGYTFNGWKNTIIPHGNLINSLQWQANQNVTVTKTNDYTQVIYNQNNSTPGYITFAANNGTFAAGKKYTVTAYVKGVNTTDLSIGLYGNIGTFTGISTSEFKKVTTTVTFASERQNYILLYKSSPTIGSGFQIKWLQIQEGEVGTEYDVTTATTVKTPQNHILMADWIPNPITFNNQTIEKTYNTAAQTANVTAATNGTGSYTYTKKSGEADITVAANGTITIPAGKNAGTYTIVINARDNESGSTKDATYTINIAKAKISIPQSPAAKTYNGAAQSSGITTPAHTSIVETPELVVNGDGSYGDNTNFTAWTYEANESYNGSHGSFSKGGGNSSPATSELFALSEQETYTLSFDAKTENGNSTFYSMINCYDIDKNLMNASGYMFISGTTTTLARDLKKGDKVIYLTNLSGWNRTTTATYQKGMIIWNYTNSQGFTYPAETYSRNYYQNLYDDGTTAVDVNAGTITLDSTRYPNGWPVEGTIPAGTAVSQSNSGWSYKYRGIVNEIIPTTWTHYSGTISEIDYSGNNAVSKFPPYAVYGKVGFLWNDNSASDTGYITNVSVIGKSITSATNVGTYSIAYDIDDKENYEWEDGTTTLKTVPWIINPYDISGSNSTIGAIANQNYTGSSIKPNPTIAALSRTLTNGTDYSLTYKDNTNPGTATVYIVGRGNFKGSKTTTFTINPQVTFNANTGTGTMANQYTTYNSNTALTANGFTKTGYTFAGWNTEANGSGTAYANQASVKFTTNTTLYAQWTANIYTLTANANNGSISATTGWTGTGATATKNVTFDASYGTLPTVSRTGYTFGGWYKENTFVNKVETSTVVKTAGNHTIYAKWTPNQYTLTANANGGTIPTTSGWTNASGNATATKSVTYDAKYGTLPTPTRNEYTFLGWYKENTFTNKVDADTVYKTAANSTIFAKWVKFTLNTNEISLKTATSTTISPDGTSGAKITYTGDGVGELAFESENTSVATVNASGTITTATNAQSGNTAKIIIKDKSTGEKIGEVTIVIDITAPSWTVKLLNVLPK